MDYKCLERKYSPDNCSSQAQIFTPAFRVPAVEECLERDLGLRVQAIVTEEAVVRRQWENDLRGTRDEVTAGLLDLDGAEETEKVDQHDAVSELGLVVKTVNLMTVLWDGGGSLS